ncbi:MAG TPA: type IX secretion system membrane protein PorP/SprF [Cyclobacteriaceae bacterium]|nr:type IX secretion system membrane protein PorP/SprF [Cyclobacteriaceae bacterium]
MKKIFTLISILYGTISSVVAQQDPIYAQYLNNPLLINPAYAGSNNNFNGMVIHRTQWAGFEGNPTTLNFNSHMSVLDNKVGVGLMLIQDKLGNNSNTEIQTMYSYKIELGEPVFIFGLQAGLLNFRTDPDKLNLQDPNDPVFINVENKTKPNIGTGFILKSERYFIGLSIPRLLNTSIEEAGQSIDIYRRHFYLNAAYVVFVNERIRFKPSVLLRGTSGSPLSIDYNASFSIDEKYTAGLFTRNFNTVGLLTQMNFAENYRIAYVFELPTGNSVGARFTTHEISFGLKMALLRFHDRSAITNF